MKTVFCQRKKAQLPALETPPFPGEIGIRIQQNISAEAWKEWQTYQTKLINEYRLRPSDPKAKQFIIDKMLAFLFEGKESEIPGFKKE
jgi:Fe-S cluster biosynthesis and repair protein YggX